MESRVWIVSIEKWLNIDKSLNYIKFVSNWDEKKGNWF